MQLCIVTHKVLKGDGQGRVNYEVSLEALRRGHRITFLASEISPDLQQHGAVQWVPIEVNSIPTYLLSNLWFAQVADRWLRRHRHQFDLIKLNGSISTAASDINAVHFVHSAWIHSPVHPARQHHNLYGLYQRAYSALNAAWEKWAFRRTRQVIAVSSKIQQELLDIHVPPEKIQVIVNGVDLQEFCPGRVDRQPWQLPGDRVLGLFAGDLRSNRKNLDTVLRAMVSVPEFHLAVAGSIQGSPYPELVQQLGLQNQVHFLGYRRDLAQLMRAMDCFVFPSRYEPFGLVVLEAMASGLPIVTATTTGAADLVTPDCGFVLSDAEDVAGLAGALRQLTDRPDLRQQMGLAARRIAEHHSWSTMAERYVDLFETIAANST